MSDPDGTPTIGRGAALFLDFDGTLVDIADRPDAIAVPEFLPGLLTALSQLLDGALAIVSGRSIADIDRHLGALLVTIAGEHGAQWRMANGSLETSAIPDFEQELAATRSRFGQRDGVLIEPKAAGFSVHYRLAPEMETPIREFLRDRLAGHSDLHLTEGKCVVELRARHVSKAAAIERFMHRDPFAGRRPIFVGDDVTDEDGFRAVNRLGGHSVKVGAGDSLARARLDAVDDVHRWLRNGLMRLTGNEAADGIGV